MNTKARAASGLALVAAAIAALALLPSGGTVAAGGIPLEVSQGPAWLAGVLYSAPPWASWAVVGAGAGAAGLAYVGYRRHGVDDEVRAEMRWNALLVLSIAAATLALKNAAPLPYWADVAGGVALGWLAATAADMRLAGD